MSNLYCNNGCPFERIGRCPENGLPERCGIQAMYAEFAAVKAERDEAHDAIRRIGGILSDPLIICNNNGGLRPVKGTTRQEVYTTLLKCQFAIGMTDRWFPSQWRGVQPERSGK